MAYQYKYDKSSCWYVGHCSIEHTEECGASCIRYMEMDYLMHLSGIPKRRQYPFTLKSSQDDLQAFKRLNALGTEIEEFVENGDNLYIFSEKTGNGKTSWAIRLMLKYFNRIWLGNGFQRRGVFIHVPTFLNKLKDFKNKDEYFEKLKEDLGDVDLVVWDDIAATNLSDYDHSNLLTYIDQRVLNYKSNIYTGNRNKETIVEALGNRLASRVFNDSEVIEFVGRDRRGER